MVNKKILSRDKIFAHKDRLNDWLSTGVGIPITAELDPTNLCNYKCLGCGGGRFPEKASLSEDDMKKIIDKISGKVKGLLFTGGGEPLFNKGTVGAIRHARKNNLDVGLITTGYLLSDDKREGIIETILQDCQWIRFSLDATDKSKYASRKVVSPQNYDIVLKNINNLVQLKKQIKSECTIGIAYLTRSESESELRKFVEIGKNLKVDYVQFRPYHDTSRDLSLDIDLCKNLESQDFKVIYPIDKYKKKRYSYEQCFGDEFRIVIGATGDLYPDCFTRGRDNFAYGNLLTQTFDDIWYSDRRQEIFSSKLRQFNCPDASRFDTLNALLWDLHESHKNHDLDKLFEQSKSISHINFV